MAGHNAGSRGRKTQRIMRSFKIEEISAVDLPAQEGARAVIMKRDGGEDDGVGLDKSSGLTTETSGHTHLLTLSTFESEQSNSGQTSFDGEHSHPWIRTEDDEIVIGAADGHTHEVAQVSKDNATVGTKEKNMSKDNIDDKDAEALKAAEGRTKELEGELAEAKARAEMTDAQKAYFDKLDPSLDDDERKMFVAAKPDRRGAIVKAAVKAEEDKRDVVYKADDGTEYFKVDDPRLVAQAKRNDELARALGKATDRADEQDLRKRAEDELNHLPGTVETRMALLKAAESIGDEDTRKTALEALKAQNESMGKAFETLGAAGKSGRIESGAATDGPESKLDVLAKRHAKEHKTTEAEGYVAVLETEEGAALYGEIPVSGQQVN